MKKISILRHLFEDYAKKQKMPVFPINSKQIKILEKPSDFYNFLIDGIKNSKFRITMNSLYLGDKHLEHKLIEELQ